jgi:glycerol dehydrogenase
MNIQSARNLSAAFPGKYIQGMNILDQLPDYIRLLGTKALIIASHTSFKNLLPRLNLKENDNRIFVEEFRGECCEEELRRLSDIMNRLRADVVVGMGGGKTIDTAKILADRAGLPVIIVPTIASTDAPCSGCAVIYSEEGVFHSVYYLKLNPQVVLVDTNVIANAPVRFLVAGMGDALSTGL